MPRYGVLKSWERQPKKIPRSLREKHPDIHKLIHEHFGVDVEMLWGGRYQGNTTSWAGHPNALLDFVDEDRELLQTSRNSDACPPSTSIATPRAIYSPSPCCVKIIACIFRNPQGSAWSVPNGQTIERCKDIPDGKKCP